MAIELSVLHKLIILLDGGSTFSLVKAISVLNKCNK